MAFVKIRELEMKRRVCLIFWVGIIVDFIFLSEARGNFTQASLRRIRNPLSSEAKELQRILDDPRIERIASSITPPDLPKKYKIFSISDFIL